MQTHLTQSNKNKPIKQQNKWKTYFHLFFPLKFGHILVSKFT